MILSARQLPKLSFLLCTLACSSVGNLTTAEDSGAGGAPITGGMSGFGGSTSTAGGRPNSGGAAGGGTALGGTAGGGMAPEGLGGLTASGGASSVGGATGGASEGGPSDGGTSTGGSSTGAGPSGVGGGAPALGAAKVWLAGDSTVANGNTPCPVGWGKSFDSLFDERITVVNSAAGGRSVRTWLYDVKDTQDGSGECTLGTTNGMLTLQERWQNMLRDMSEGDYLLIQFGINDGDSTCPRHVGIDAFRESYRMMAEAALERGAQPVFLTPASAIACNGSTAVATRGFLDATLDEGAALGVPVIDLHARSIALYNSLQFCPVAGGDVSAATTGAVGAFFCDDHTHFDTPGALEIAKLVAKGLQDAEVRLAEYLL